ncbi:hypothetical protein [Roseovarius confluentis]|uniref:hypothetical protein n=1 Tax=Roseovarius confluentis TaxID=1852027 RepID=UPI0011AEDE81|nr:hypothetical protein [Roseovarius confluentis]
MINAYSIGFVLTAGTILAGVDYYDQSNRAGFSLGEMTPGAYIETIPNRFSSAKEEKLAEHAERERKSRWRQGGLVFLPEAPEGWERRALLEGDDSAILPPEAGLDGSMSNSAGKGLMQQMEARDHVKQLKERATRSWIYQRGTETVFVEVRLVERPSSNSLFGIVASAMDGTMMDAFERNVGYGVTGGFGLTEKLGHDGDRPYHFRYLEGSIGFGNEVHLRVHANASREATQEILSRIDYDGLNDLLPRPVPSVGNDVSLPDGIDPAALSMELRRLKSEFLSLRALEAQYKIENIDTGAMVLSAYSMRLGGQGGDVDITGGKVTDLSGLIELGYFRGREAVMAGKSAEVVQAEVKQMVDTVMMVADAETAAAAARAANAPEPETSPELQAELAALSGDTNMPVSTGQTSNARDTAAIAAANRARDMDDSASAKILMQVDEGKSDRDAGMIYSKAIDLVEFESFRAARNATDEEMEMGMAIAASGFERKHDLPQGSCSFDMGALRLECDTSKGVQPNGLLSKLINQVTGGEEVTTLTPQRTEPAAKPKRLELSNGSSGSGQRCVGSFCD